MILPPDICKMLPKNRLLSEAEWRSLGVQQSRGWVHYAIHRPEPHIMLFRLVLEQRGRRSFFLSECRAMLSLPCMRRRPLHQSQPLQETDANNQQ